MRTILLIIVSLFSTMECLAHPVTFQGGTAVIFRARPQFSRLEVNHSLLPSLAVGATYQRLSLLDRPEQELDSLSAQLNWLVKRWNLKEAQGNFYLLGGGGCGRFDKTDTLLYGYAGAQVDFETQRVYTALKGSANWTKRFIPYHVQYRFGVAPYKGGYKELNVWFVAQVDHAPRVLGDFTFSPVLRFFYRNTLWEIGSSTKGDWFLTLMAHF